MNPLSLGQRGPGSRGSGGLLGTRRSLLHAPLLPRASRSLPGPPPPRRCADEVVRALPPDEAGMARAIGSVSRRRSPRRRGSPSAARGPSGPGVTGGRRRPYGRLAGGAGSPAAASADTPGWARPVSPGGAVDQGDRRGQNPARDRGGAPRAVV